MYLQNRMPVPTSFASMWLDEGQRDARECQYEAVGFEIPKGGH